jgi:hypothetical protein
MGVRAGGTPAAGYTGCRGFDGSGVPGTIVDHSPAASGRYIGSPSIAVLADGTFAVSHDFFGPQANHWEAGFSVVFLSKDEGRTWRRAAAITPLFWGKLFVHQEALYILGTRHEYGDVLIRRSDDGGWTWTQPDSPQTGLLRQGRYHCAPCPTLSHGGRIWRSFEAFTGGEWGNFSALVSSAPADGDLLNGTNWRFGEALPRQRQFVWLEGNLVLDPDHRLLNILRTNYGGDDKAAIVHVEAGDGRLSYDHPRDFIDMPGGGVKFTIRYDRRTSRYWSIVSQQTMPEAYRNNLVLTSSADLRTWRVESPLLWHPDAGNHAWQYVDWQFQGEDIIFVSRTAFDDGLGGAHRAHDANYLTFHRITRFRSRAPGPLTSE